MYNYECEYCEGMVQPKTVKREAFKHKRQFVMLEDVIVGVCNGCGNRYYSADILHALHNIATGVKPPEKKEEVLVSHMA